MTYFIYVILFVDSDKTLTDCTLLAKHHPPKVIKQSNELTPEQHCNEYEVLYAQYLMTLYMKESLKKKMIDEDEIAAVRFLKIDF